MAEYDLNFKDFSLPEAEMQPKRFKVHPDTFTAPALLSAPTIAALAGFAGKFAQMQNDDGTSNINVEDIPGLMEDVGDFFVELLDEESGPKFRARLLGKTDPIDLIRQALPIMFWLMEVYGLRPTQPSSGSATGSDDGGPGSTDGAPNDGSTP